MLLIPCPWCGPRDEAEFHYGGQAHVAVPGGPVGPDRRGVGPVPVLPRQPEGPVRRALEPRGGLPPLVQRGPGHGTNEILAVYRAGEERPAVEEPRRARPPGQCFQPVRRLRTRPFRADRGLGAEPRTREGVGWRKPSRSDAPPEAGSTGTPPSPSPSTAPNTRATTATPSPRPSSPTASSTPAPASNSAAREASSPQASRNPTPSSRSRPRSPNRCCPPPPWSCTTASRRPASPARAGSPRPRTRPATTPYTPTATC